MLLSAEGILQQRKSWTDDAENPPNYQERYEGINFHRFDHMNETSF